ncbi:MAG: helix-turn-helix domain-containing protein [Clostridia bacterium]|nr:helix-turn-helix domain-containing protein [Clostridia bacterium]
MEISLRIRYFRNKFSLTQDQLAEKLCVSAQAVSKWENNVSMPDIMLLPKIAEVFGVSIDELFNLTVEQKLKRIENRMQIEDELEDEVFKEYEEYLLSLRETHEDKTKITGLIARLYHHKMEAFSRKAARFAREAIQMAPEKKECQWLLQKTEGSQPWDWNVSNHAGIIDFYKSVIENDKDEKKTALPYYYLIDNLIADSRTEEAKEYLKVFRKMPCINPCMPDVYDAMIALAEHNTEKADAIMESALLKFNEEGDILFEAAQYYAKKAEYDKAIRYYEASYAYEERNKPRFTDALEAIAAIYEIKGAFGKAAETYERILENLKTEWGMKEESAVFETQRKINDMIRKNG